MERDHDIRIHDDMHDRFGCAIEVSVRESEGACECTATMTTERGTFTGHGHSRRHPDDPVVPMIGEELAVGRALRDLGGQLMAAAGDAIDDQETRPIHLLQPS